MPRYKVVVQTAEGKKKIVVQAPDQKSAEAAAVKECKNG
jgi:hypothetical protein